MHSEDPAQTRDSAPEGQNRNGPGRKSAELNRFRLANQILNVIRDARMGVGHHLREQQFAELLNVSRTPIRSALSLLVEHGVVEARRNQGFFLTTPYIELHEFDIDVPPSAEQDLYERLVRDRIAGELPGSVTQSDIARIYEADRIVILRTLARMADDGLVARNKGHGWTFLPTLDTNVGLANSYAFRLVLEPAGILQPGFTVKSEVMERVRLHHVYLLSHPDINRIDPAQLFSTDSEFHEMLADFSGNIFFTQAVQQQNRLRKLLEFATYVDRRRVREWCREHLSIIEAISAGDREGAASQLREHLQHALNHARAKG
ncbi:GntR family transcriptional regulator [Pseudogemmobacter sonorensis]|uniref:GntR family transcriptional regulator n=1 Tax=Pseudogemmobacter sonorensis TaxID=2989681 RepID=UPI0036AF0260